ncbi:MULTISPECIES: membrane protein insertase YidC [unclassified Methylophaga]|jgi:YidC/Oxa1 family membrane protein insertase|uniref:membrane protein insertase YidC n=2 Tax=Methylophaga TaxID=40222 RepID=UPI000C10620E|nr:MULTISPECIES: membrane protein insertase YidC [unclassified Methylophaga]MBL1458690.1 membrane protein insertase YidC [Methylophaga sp.]|tara:strand:- start:1345 stop:2988 length:1644 start_codon:yes stop_codon:yes gene_type:complete
MDNLRTLFIFGLLIVSLLLWEAWQNDYVRPQQVATQNNVDQPVSESAPSQDDLPELPAVTADGLPALPESEQASASSANQLRIKTDVIEATIDLRGADIRELALLQYPVDVDLPDEPVQFLNDSRENFFVTQSGLRAEGTAPTHYETYTAEQSEYVMGENSDSLSVPMRWESDNGLTVIKTYTFTRDSYLVDVNYQIENQSGERFAAYPYAQFNRNQPEDDSFMIYTYTGAVFSSPGNEYEKVDFGELEKNDFRRDVNGGWAAMIQHYFVAAFIPAEPLQEISLYGKAINNTNYTAGIRFPAVVAENGEQAQTSYQIYLGPKEHQRLEPIADNLDLTVDYGILTIISKPLFIVMEWLHKLTGNWGWSIVLLTILIKLAFYKLSAASYRSMASMRKLTPKLATLKERYGDDKQKFNQAMMDLYRTEKINPLGGCLPILVQMPVFLAFYWVLVESIELRQADFILWINDLTAMDPYFVLPVLFGLSMWFQQKLNPMPQDPAQAMMMKIFPIVFTVFFAFFPAGLVLYWVVNNLLSIAQQWYITRKMGAL